MHLLLQALAVGKVLFEFLIFIVVLFIIIIIFIIMIIIIVMIINISSIISTVLFVISDVIIVLIVFSCFILFPTGSRAPPPCPCRRRPAWTATARAATPGGGSPFFNVYVCVMCYSIIDWLILFA